MENKHATTVSSLETIPGTFAESYDELIIDEIAASATRARLAMIGSRLNAVSVSIMNRSTVNNIRIEQMKHLYIADLITDTPEFHDDSPEGQNKRAEQDELLRKSNVAATLTHRATPETIPRQYSYDELIANRIAISRRIGIITRRVSEVYIEHNEATLELIKVRDQIRAAEALDDSLTIAPIAA